MPIARNAAAKSAQRLASAYVKPAAFDADEDALREEFAGLDMTDFEQAEFAEVLRLRIGSKSEQIAARAILAKLRESLDRALTTTLEHHAREHGSKAASHRRSDAVRLTNRDGLNELYLRGKITRGELASGLAYRLRYEAASASIRSSMATPTSAPQSADDMVAGKTTRAKWEIARIQAEQTVAEACSWIGLQLLRNIAGEGKSMNSQLDEDHRSSADYEAATELLARGLRICGHVFPNNEA